MTTYSAFGVTTAAGSEFQSKISVGSAGQVFTSNGTSSLPSFQALSAANGVTSTNNLTDNAVVRGDGGAKGVQTSTMLISDAGEMTNPSQPAFLAYLHTLVADVTGDNTEYTVIFDAEAYDQGGDFDLGTSIFTAPVTGKYLLCFAAILANGTVITSSASKISSSNRNYGYNSSLASGLTTATSFTQQVIADMDAADVVGFTVRSTDSGGKIDDIIGTSATLGYRTYVSGALIC